eukprot:13235765-Ditylum_brightwellii.AAC.1
MLYSLRYTITIAFGEGAHQNWRKLLVYVFGIGQGLTDSPSGWLFISNVILKCYTQLAKGCILQDPTEMISMPTHADMFVNDNTLMHNAQSFSAPTWLIINNKQHDTEIWGRLLWVSGELNDRTPTISTNLPPNNIRLMDAQESTMKLKCVAPYEGIAMLGVRKAANLQETTGKTYLRKKLERFIKAISACPLRAHEVWLSYKTILIGSITYPFACTSFLAKGLDGFHQRLLPILLP